MRILVIANDSPFLLEAVRAADFISRQTSGTFEIIAVSNDPETEADLKRVLPDQYQAPILIKNGDFFQVLDVIDQGNYDLALIGADRLLPPGGTPIHPTIRLASHCKIPLGIVRKSPESWNRALICARKIDPQSDTILKGNELVKKLGLHPTLLSIIPDSPLQDELPAPKVELGDLAPSYRIRRGPVLAEIQAEIETGDYDLIIIGPHKPEALKIGGDTTLAQPDIAVQIIRRIPQIVLVLGQPEKVIPEQTTSVLSKPRELKRIIRYVAVELIIYAILVVAYAAIAFHFLVDPLEHFFRTNLTVYAFIAILLIIGQGTLLEMITSFLLDRLRLERFE